MEFKLSPAESVHREVLTVRNPVIVADIHLSNDKPATKEAFFKFLNKDASRFSELFILGDLFEFWAGDDGLAAYQDVINELRTYSIKGHHIYVMHGNRDFLLGSDFQDAIGGTLIADPTLMKLGTELCLLSHGDEWCTLDTGYQQFRKTLRNAAIQKQILAEKLEDRIDLANSLRSQSKHENRKKDDAYMDVVVGEISKSAHHYGCATVIHGHTHKPAHHTHVNDDFRFDRWVLPDWDFENGNKKGGYLCFESGYLHFGHLD